MKYINSFYLKMIGIVTMTIDHIGFILVPQIWLRIVGRIAFPIFAFLIAEGFRHTHDRYKYLMRLSIFAIVIQSPFYIIKLFNLNIAGLDSVPTNIFFTLALGLYTLIILDDAKQTIQNNTLNIWVFIKSYWQIILVIFMAFLFNVDYGLYGVFLIVIMYYFKDIKLIIAVSAYNVLFLIGSNMLPSVFSYKYLLHYSGIQIYSLLSLIFIIMYNSKRGYKVKYLFYIYYPLHLCILFLISMFI